MKFWPLLVLLLMVGCGGGGTFVGGSATTEADNLSSSNGRSQGPILTGESPNQAQGAEVSVDDETTFAEAITAEATVGIASMQVAIGAADCQQPEIRQVDHGPWQWAAGPEQFFPMDPQLPINLGERVCRLIWHLNHPDLSGIEDLEALELTSGEIVLVIERGGQIELDLGSAGLQWRSPNEIFVLKSNVELWTDGLNIDQQSANPEGRLVIDVDESVGQTLLQQIGQSMQLQVFE